MFSYINTDFTEGKGYTPIVHGNSYVQVVTWDDDGTPDARAILTYSQSPESDSPHYYDQTELYARGERVRLERISGGRGQVARASSQAYWPTQITRASHD